MSKNGVVLTLLLAGILPIASGQTPAPATATPNPAPLNVVLQDGSAVKLRLSATAAGSSVRVGETLELEVAEDVRVGDVVVIAKGSLGSASITNLRSGGNVKGGWIDIDLDSITLPDGERVSIRSSKQQPIRNDQSNIISSQARDASISQGADLTVFVNGTQQIDMTRLRAASGPTTTLKLTSTPPNAEVSLDGRLAGSTPSSLRVTSGDHVLVVRMAGFQPWQKKIHVEAEPVAVDVALSKQDGSEPAPTTKPAEASLGDLARAARARKPQSSPATTVLEQDGATVANQTGQRDPMQAQSPKR